MLHLNLALNCLLLIVKRFFTINNRNTSELALNENKKLLQRYRKLEEGNATGLQVETGNRN